MWTNPFDFWCVHSVNMHMERNLVFLGGWPGGPMGGGGWILPPKLALSKKLPIFNLLFILDNFLKKKKCNAKYFVYSFCFVSRITVMASYPPPVTVKSETKRNNKHFYSYKMWTNPFDFWCIFGKHMEWNLVFLGWVAPWGEWILPTKNQKDWFTFFTIVFELN